MAPGITRLAPSHSHSEQWLMPNSTRYSGGTAQDLNLIPF